MKNSNLSISNLTRKCSEAVGEPRRGAPCSEAVCKVANKTYTEIANKIHTEIHTEIANNSVSKRSEAACKLATEMEIEPEERLPNKIPAINENLPNKAKKPFNENLPALPTTFRNYTPKIRQQVMSNKLLNSQLYELYTVRKLHCVGAWLKANIVDGTITIAKQTYIVSWSDILPIDAYKEDTILLSLRNPKYKDSRTGEYPHSYAVVSKIVE